MGAAASAAGAGAAVCAKAAPPNKQAVMAAAVTRVMIFMVKSLSGLNICQALAWSAALRRQPPGSLIERGYGERQA